MRNTEKLVETLLMLIGLSSVAILGLIILFIFKEGLPAFTQLGVWQFITGTRWSPGKGVMGILPMIVGSFLVTAGALLVGLPLGLGCAIYLSEFATKKTAAILKPMIELLAGIPSVVFGFIGLAFIVPFIRNFFGGPGFSVLASALVLSIMILPTMVSVSYDALRAVPSAYREGMLALGSTDWQAVRMVVLPAARPGILAAAILAMGRAVGETMAVIMVAGNSTIVPTSFLDPVRTMTSNIALEMGYATGLHRQALFATGVVLFVIISILNLTARAVVRGK
ncbi:MAG: phosphate ABC transporter permease subunit PstC [bacterium]|jgi:phosphate transport system permease protein